MTATDVVRLEDFELDPADGHLGLCHVPCGALRRLARPWTAAEVQQSIDAHRCGRAW
jgi:hypothetical protein